MTMTMMQKNNRNQNQSKQGPFLILTQSCDKTMIFQDRLGTNATNLDR